MSKSKYTNCITKYSWIWNRYHATKELCIMNKEYKKIAEKFIKQVKVNCHCYVSVIK